MNEKCYVSTLWSQYFLNESDIASAGQLDKCNFGYNYCKVLFVRNFKRTLNNYSSFIFRVITVNYIMNVQLIVKVTHQIQNAYFTIKHHVQLQFILKLNFKISSFKT